MKSFATFLFCLLITAAAAAQSVQPAPPVSAEQMAAIYPGVESLYIDLHKSPELAFHEQQTAAKLAERVKALGYEVTTGVGGRELLPS